MAERDENGRLTREGMEAVIRSGGSVMIDGEVVTDMTKLPSAVDLARGNEKATALLKKQLDEQLQALLLQRAKVDEDEKAAKEKTAADVKEVEKQAVAPERHAPPATHALAPAVHEDGDEDKPERRPVGRPRKEQP